MSMYLFASATISQAVNFEWAGIFSTPRTEYLWTAQKVGGLYADPRMRLVLRETADADADTLSSIRDEGIAALNGTCIETRSGEVLAPGRCYDLVFSVHMWQTLFPVQANGVALAIFTQHVPTEFESSAHYLKDADGYDVVPVSEIFASPSTIKAVPWGTGIGAVRKSEGSNWTTLSLRTFLFGQHACTALPSPTLPAAFEPLGEPITY